MVPAYSYNVMNVMYGQKRKAHFFGDGMSIDKNSVQVQTFGKFSLFTFTVTTTAVKVKNK